jgi:tRNA threonylcarbamoyl adenosine modification protein YjeE
VTGSRRQTTRTANETEAVARALSQGILPGDLVLLEGDLAAGKTTFVRGLTQGLNGDPADVSSPSFVVIQTYPCSADQIARLHHVDLYRIGDAVPDLRELGIEDVLSDPEAVIAVEWPKDTLARWLPADSRVWRVQFTTTDSDARVITISDPE